MSGSFEDYIAQHWAGIKEGAGDIARAGLHDIQNAYDAILTGRRLGPPEALTATFE